MFSDDESKMDELDDAEMLDATPGPYDEYDLNDDFLASDDDVNDLEDTPAPPTKRARMDPESKELEWKKENGGFKVRLLNSTNRWRLASPDDLAQLAAQGVKL